ncbi:MAG TPA: MarR family winged helix-turn-helix transcriptional regulator [Burkholderiaceae bacterium]|nr:MarR family winged helix-turn-helix transcriptional regulator [Burkholderiaceae bacterium]
MSSTARSRHEDAAPAAAPLVSGCTCLALRKTARRVSMIYDQCLEPYGLTITQYGLLAHLRRQGPVGIGTMAQQLIMDPTTLSRNLRPLERQHCVRFEQDPQDRRARRVLLTDEGSAALRRARPGWERAQQQIERSLGLADTVLLHRSLATALEQLAP